MNIGGEGVIKELTSISKDIDTAAEIYGHYLSGKELKSFENTVTLTRNLLNKHLPEALAPWNEVYPGENRTPTQAKQELLSLIEKLKSFAKSI